MNWFFQKCRDLNLHIILLLIGVSTFNSCLLFQHKRLASKTAEQVSQSLQDLTNEEKVKKLAKSAIEGVMDGTSSETSRESLDELTRILSENIGQELNNVFAHLDTKTPGENFSNGVVNSLVNKEVEAKLKQLLANTANGAQEDFGQAIQNLEKDINKSLTGIVRNLNNQISTLDESLQAVLSNSLQDSLSHFFNNAIADIELKPLSHKISTDLISTELRDSIISLATAVQNNIDITEPLPGIVTLLRQNAIILSLLGFFLIASLIYWSYYLRKKSILGDDLTEILHKLKETDDQDLIYKLESFLKEKGHYEFYQQQVNRLKKKKQ